MKCKLHHYRACEFNMTEHSVLYSSDNLKALWDRPSDTGCEPTANFPLGYYKFFLEEINRLHIQVITYYDIFNGCDDWNHKSFFPQEYKYWKACKSDPEKVYLLIQHDVDNHPFFTKRMVAMEYLHGIRSNIFIFRDRYSKKGNDILYDIDHEFFGEMEKHGFVIGYHQNAFALSGFDMEKAVGRYISDVKYLRRIYNIDFVVPHGGTGCFVNGEKLCNCDVPMPKEFRHNLRWVFNRYGVKFDTRWSDGGLRKTRDRKRIQSFDLVNHFLRKLKKGSRNFCLIHPQRWGYNVDPQQNPLLAMEQWYKDICNNVKKS